MECAPAVHAVETIGRVVHVIVVSSYALSLMRYTMFEPPVELDLTCVCTVSVALATVPSAVGKRRYTTPVGDALSSSTLRSPGTLYALGSHTAAVVSCTTAWLGSHTPSSGGGGGIVVHDTTGPSTVSTMRSENTA